MEENMELILPFNDDQRGDLMLLLRLPNFSANALPKIFIKDKKPEPFKYNYNWEITYDEKWVDMWYVIADTILSQECSTSNCIRIICKICRISKLLDFYISKRFKNFYLKKINTQKFEHLDDISLSTLHPYVTTLRMAPMCCCITDRSVKKLVNLTRLDIWSKAITDESIKHLTNLTSLSLPKYWGTGLIVTDRSIKMLTNLTLLNVNTAENANPNIYRLYPITYYGLKDLTNLILNVTDDEGITHRIDPITETAVSQAIYKGNFT
jgi:hypothetical protein